MMTGIEWFLITVFISAVLFYHQASLRIWMLTGTILILFHLKFSGLTLLFSIVSLFFIFTCIFLYFKKIRLRFLTKPLFNLIRPGMPTMSRTEREAISAGSVTWEADLLQGKPNWEKLHAYAPAQLSTEEIEFLNGPVNELCELVNDWEITHHLYDLPEKAWDFIKANGFFGLIIPKKYGGKGFSALAHSQIITKLSGRSVATAITVSVPNSLGPAELLLHYGTEEQKNHYLPRLARGEEIPCFALTSPVAGSDAGAMIDEGIVCYQTYQGEKTLGIKLNFNKRYITLAPIATVIGLAFKLYDPDRLIGKKENVGITCALIPREIEGIEIGRRHYPLDCPFQNGPIKGKDIFIPIDYIIGGINNAGKGWSMLMECLAVGRSISLPASALGGAKLLVYSIPAYAKIRKQFNLSIGKFEGIQEPLARIGAYTYLMDAARHLTSSIIDTGAKPAIASAILKYHLTEMGRKIGIDGMDILGGKAICLGPHNFIGRTYQATPIAITVEGANILTRNMIIFGQGVIRCHPYLLNEIEAMEMKDEYQGLNAFDKVLYKHIAYTISRAIRVFVTSITGSFFVRTPHVKMKRYYQQATRFSATLAFITDVCLLIYGGNLKRKESLSARLGDILSHLYLLSGLLKYFRDQGENPEELPFAQYAGLSCLFEIQERFDEILKNFPIRWLAYLLKFIIFPLGERFSKPRSKMNRKIAERLMQPDGIRLRLSQGVYDANIPSNPLADLQDALNKVFAAEPIEKIIKNLAKANKIEGNTLLKKAQSALEQSFITIHQFNLLQQAEMATAKATQVDDFSNDEL